MAVLIPIKEIEVNDFNEFCIVFCINSKKSAGENGFDIDLIIDELIKRKNEKWVVNFIDDKIDGFFRLQLFE